MATTTPKMKQHKMLNNSFSCLIDHTRSISELCKSYETSLIDSQTKSYFKENAKNIVEKGLTGKRRKQLMAILVSLNNFFVK